MNLTSSAIEWRALQLAFNLAASGDGRISRKLLCDHFGAEADLLISLGAVAPDGYASSVATWEDSTASIEWSAEQGCFGYFSETDGWVNLAPSALTTFALQLQPLVRQLVSRMDVYPKDLFHEINSGLLWELGTCRLPGRSKRVALWVARRLQDAGVWRSFIQATRDRPTQDVRMVLHLSESEIPDAPFVANHAVIAVGSVLSSTSSLEIDAEVAAARLQTPHKAGGPITMSADGGRLMVHGRVYLFRGGKQRSIVRSLFDAWVRGDPHCLTEEVLVESESGLSVRRLARAFKGHPNWHEVIKEHGGFCWLEIG